MTLLTLLRSLEMTEAEEESTTLLLRDIEAATVRVAAQVALLLIAGCTKREIRKQLGLREQDYQQLVDQLRRCLDADAGERLPD